MVRRYTREDWGQVFDGTLGERLPGAPEQGIYESVTAQRYKIGARLAIDERVFRYARIAGVDALGGRAVANVNTDAEHAAAPADHAIGAKQVTITVQTAAPGLLENELQGGYLCYKKTRYYRHRIASHPAAANGATCVLTLETAIVGHAIAIGDVLIAYHSPWAGVGHGATYGGGVSFVGWPFGDIAVGQYTWVQTWGPVNGAPAVFIGGNPSERAVWFASDGSLTTFPTAGPQGGYQYAGFYIPSSCIGGSGGVITDMQDGGHLFMLQIAP